MKWNLRMAAAQRDVWKASQLHSMLADAGLVISAGEDVATCGRAGRSRSDWKTCR